MAYIFRDILLALKNKGQEQEDGNPVDFLRNTYGKCHTDD